jgi:hypothetical protein
MDTPHRPTPENPTSPDEATATPSPEAELSHPDTTDPTRPSNPLPHQNNPTPADSAPDQGTPAGPTPHVGDPTAADPSPHLNTLTNPAPQPGTPATGDPKPDHSTLTDPTPHLAVTADPTPGISTPITANPTHLSTPTADPAANLSTPADPPPHHSTPAAADPLAYHGNPATTPHDSTPTIADPAAHPSTPATPHLGAPATTGPLPHPDNPATTNPTPHHSTPTTADPATHLNTPANHTPHLATPATADPLPYLGDPIPHLGDPPPYPGDPSVAVLPGSDWAPPPQAFPQPPIAPQPPRPPKSTAAALLLNLTGLGLGYAYLRRRLLLAITLAVTAGLLTTAFLTNAATYPWSWRGLFLGWLAIIAIHTALVARRHPPATSRTGVIGGVAAVALLAAGYVGYGIAGDTIHTAGVDAQKAGNCATALDQFDTVTGPFELTLSENVTDAEARTVECGDYASALSAQKNGKYDNAVNQYLDFERNYPHSVLRTFVHDNLADSYVNRAAHWQLPLTTGSATHSGDTLMMVVREFGDTPAAKRVPKTMTDLYAAATAVLRPGAFCDWLPTLTYFAGLDPKVVKDVVAAANTQRADALYQCGINLTSANAEDAATTLDTFLKAYPQDPRVPQARSAMISAQVAAANNVLLPVPPPLGDNSPGNIPVTFYNDSNTVMTILVAGPTAHEIILPPCAVCPASYPPGADVCPTFDGRPSLKLELPPATYYFLIVGDQTLASNIGSVTPLVDYEHTECMYIEQH